MKWGFFVEESIHEAAQDEKVKDILEFARSLSEAHIKKIEQPPLAEDRRKLANKDRRKL
jgi:formate dehydrogenase maturation protein FdhE